MTSMPLIVDLMIEKRVRWPWRHQTTRPSLDAQLSWSHLMTVESDKQRKDSPIIYCIQLRESQLYGNYVMSIKQRWASHISVAECDSSSFVKRSLEGESSYQLFSRKSDLFPLDHKHFTWSKSQTGFKSHDKTNISVFTSQMVSYHYPGIAQ